MLVNTVPSSPESVGPFSECHHNQKLARRQNFQILSYRGGFCRSYLIGRYDPLIDVGGASDQGSYLIG
jgi:hypothetical protein